MRTQYQGLGTYYFCMFPPHAPASPEAQNKSCKAPVARTLRFPEIRRVCESVFTQVLVPRSQNVKAIRCQDRAVGWTVHCLPREAQYTLPGAGDPVDQTLSRTERQRMIAASVAVFDEMPSAISPAKVSVVFVLCPRCFYRKLE